ncbi:MAG: hypothetical protein PXY39_03035 [archaeon]|nr:hypothetical protein [archaeon]
MDSIEFSKHVRQRKYSCPFCDSMWKKERLSGSDELAYETHLLKVHGLGK